MSRLVYDPLKQELSLKNLTTSETISTQEASETVHGFIRRIDEREHYNDRLDFKDNLLLGKQMLEDNVYRGVVMEGIPATYAQTLEIINNVPINSGLRPSQINEIVSLKRAWDYVLNDESYEEKSREINLDFIKKIHRMIGANMESLKQDQVGALRTIPIYVGGVKNHDFGIPDQITIEDELKHLSDINDPVIRALNLFLYLCKTQMFRDGNKRTANLCANYVLIENGCGLLSIREDLVPDFKVLLIHWYEEGNATDMMNLLLNKCYLYNHAGKAFIE